MKIPTLVISATETTERARKIFGGRNEFELQVVESENAATQIIDQIIKSGGLRAYPPFVLIIGDGWYQDGFKAAVPNFIRLVREKAPTSIIVLWTILPCHDEEFEKATGLNYAKDAMNAGADMTEQCDGSQEAGLPDRILSSLFQETK